MWAIEMPLEPLAFSEFQATGESCLCDNERLQHAKSASVIQFR